MSLIERMDDAPPDDGMTVDAEPGNAAPIPQEALPPSKLPVGQQFDCLVAWWKADADHSREWRQDTRMWNAFRAGEQWTPEDKALLDSQQRPHIVFNRILTILKAVAGMEINGRHEIHFIPRGTTNTAVNEVLSAASKWMADECDAEDEQSQAFDNTCTSGMGWCLSDDALVRLPKAHFATTRLYSGAVVHVCLENGKELTGTPNHPVLTDMGWKRLCELNEGDNLINSSFLEGVDGLSIEQFEKVETRLKDKIDAFRTGREMTRLATAPDDFYSDGAGSEVHIVYADRLLTDKIRQTSSCRILNKFEFTLRYLLARVGMRFSLKRLRNRSFYASVCKSALNRIHSPIGDFFRFWLGSQRVAGGMQSAAHGFIAASEGFTDLNSGHFVNEVKLRNFFGSNWQVARASAPRPHSKPSLPETIGNGRPGYAKFIADFFDWKPILEVEARKLIRGDIGSLRYLTPVRRKSIRNVVNFAVHDIGTSIGFFIAGNIITSNTEQRMSYEDDPAGLYVEESVDPLEMYWDRTAKKKNLSDSRRNSRVRTMPLGDAMGLFPGKTRDQLDARWADDMLSDYPMRSIEEKRKRDTENVLGLPYDDQTEVTIVQMQWWERETYWIVADPATNTKAELSDQQHSVFSGRMKQLGMDVKSARMQRKVYKSAFLGSEMLKPAGPSPIKGQFSWKCVTGEFDASKGTFYGLVKVLRDPQMWANKWLSQILHILNTTAKGGIIAELDAFDDQREAEDKYAHPDTITWAANGAISGQNPKIMPKPGTGNVQGYVDLMTFAIAAPYQVTGINLELLGQQDQNQPGVIESMRKQAGMTVLATLFDSLRRFRKQVGRGRLYFIQNFLSDNRLIRITGPDYVKAVPLAKEQVTGEYDVIVDDTPTSPNQKEANWAIIQPLLVVFKEQLMQNPKVFAMLLEYSPLPSRIVEAVKGFIDQAANDPQAQQDQQLAKKLGIDAQVALISKDQSIAEMNNAKAGASQATAMYDIAIAKNLLAKNDTDGLANHLKMMELAQSQQKTSAEVDHTNAKTAREVVGAKTDLMKAHNDTIKTVANAHSSAVGNVIDHLSAQNEHVAAFGGLHRDMASARKSHAEATLTSNTPPPQPEPPAVPVRNSAQPVRVPHRMVAKAKMAKDGHSYISDPMRPGKFLRVVQ